MIILIDDEKNYLEILERLLKKHGKNKYKLFFDYEEFLKEIKENRSVTVAVIDHDLKAGPTGLDLVDMIRKINNYCKLIICSGQKDLEVAVEYYEKGCYFYLYKDRKDFDQMFITKINEAIEEVHLLLIQLTAKKAIGDIIKGLRNE